MATRRMGAAQRSKRRMRKAVGDCEAISFAGVAEAMTWIKEIVDHVHAHPEMGGEAFLFSSLGGGRLAQLLWRRSTHPHFARLLDEGPWRPTDLSEIADLLAVVVTAPTLLGGVVAFSCSPEGRLRMLGELADVAVEAWQPKGGN